VLASSCSCLGLCRIEGLVRSARLPRMGGGGAVGESVTLRDQAVQRRCSLVKVTVAGSGFFHQQLSFPLWDDGTLAPCLHHTPPLARPNHPPIAAARTLPDAKVPSSGVSPFVFATSPLCSARRARATTCRAQSCSPARPCSSPEERTHRPESLRSEPVPALPGWHYRGILKRCPAACLAGPAHHS
jgi:hypothetical protein